MKSGHAYALLQKLLPLGEMKMVPGSFFTTLRKIEPRAENAFAKLINTQESGYG